MFAWVLLSAVAATATGSSNNSFRVLWNQQQKPWHWAPGGAVTTGRRVGQLLHLAASYGGEEIAA